MAVKYTIFFITQNSNITNAALSISMAIFCSIKTLATVDISKVLFTTLENTAYPMREHHSSLLILFVSDKGKKSYKTCSLLTKTPIFLSLSVCPFQPTFKMLEEGNSIAEKRTLPTNIRPCWKGLPMTNTLAYYEHL
jgi:hypothetical protein